MSSKSNKPSVLRFFPTVSIGITSLVFNEIACISYEVFSSFKKEIAIVMLITQN